MKFEVDKQKAKAIFGIFAGITVFLYSFLTFIIFGFDGGSSFWISFAFANVGILLAYFIAYLSVKSAKKLADWVFSFPIIRWCAIYAVVEILTALLFMIIEASWQVVFVPQFLLMIFFLVLALPCFLQKSHVEDVKKETAYKVSYIRQMHAKLLVLIPRTEDAELKKTIEKAADMLRHSDPMTADSLIEIEQKLIITINQIDDFVRQGNFQDAMPLAKELCLTIDERNKLAIAAKLTQY